MAVQFGDKSAAFSSVTFQRMLLPVLSLALFPPSVSADCWSDFRNVPYMLPYCCGQEDAIPAEYVATCDAWNDSDACSPTDYTNDFGCFYYCLSEDIPRSDNCEVVLADHNSDYSAGACRWMLSNQVRNTFMFGACRTANDQCPNEFCPLYSFYSCWEQSRLKGGEELGRCCGEWWQLNESLTYSGPCGPLSRCEAWSGTSEDYCHGYCVGGRHGELEWCRDLIYERCEPDDVGQCCGDYHWLTGSDHSDCAQNVTDCADPALGDVDFCAGYCEANTDQNWSWCPEWRFLGCLARAGNLSDFGGCCGRFPTFSAHYDETCAGNISACADARWSSAWCSGYCSYVNESWCNDPRRTRTATISRSLVATATASRTPTASPSRTVSKSPSLSQSPPATPTASRTPTASPSSTISMTPSLSMSPLATPTASCTPTASPSSTISMTPSLSMSPHPTPTASRTPTASASRSISMTPSLSMSPPPTPTASRTPTASPSPHPTPTRTVSRTFPASSTRPMTPWPTPSLHPTQSPSATPTYYFVDLSEGHPQTIGRTTGHVVVRGVGLLINDTEGLNLPNITFEAGTNCSVMGIGMAGSVALYGDAVLRAAPGYKIEIFRTTEITFWAEVLGEPARYAVPFLDLGAVGADFAGLPGKFTVNLSVESIEEFAELTTWSEPVVTAQTLNCENWAELADIGNRLTFGTQCSPRTARRVSEVDAAPASTLFVRGKPPAPGYNRGTESILLEIVLFVLAALVVAGTAVVFFIVCKGPPPPEKSGGDIPPDAPPGPDSLDTGATEL